MTLDLRIPGEIWLTTVDYLKGVLEDLPEVIIGRSTILAANHLFKVRTEDEWTLLKKERATEFRHTVAQLIFVTSRDRKDINISIDFLCTRIRIPYKDEWVNIMRVII